MNILGRTVTRWRSSSSSLIAVVVVALLAGCSGAGPAPERSRRANDSVGRDIAPDEQWREVEVALPSYPLEENLAPFQIRGNTSYTFFADTESVRIDEDAVVRFTVVARAPSGLDNVSFEGIHCEEKRYKIYAVGSADHEWSLLPNPHWAQLETTTYNDYRYSLYQHYLCPKGFPHARVREAVLALKHGKPVFKSR